MKRRSFCLVIPGTLLLLAVLCAASVYVSLSRWPSLGARGAEVVRSIVGDKPVAYLEMVYFQTQDRLQQAMYAYGFAEAEAPWEVPAASSIPPTLTPSPSATSAPAILVEKENDPAQQQDGGQGTPAHLTSSPTLSPTQLPPTQEPTPTPWAPETVQVMGELDGEGIWSPYIYSPSEQVVAYRTFVQPDVERPYSVVAVVAFDLSKIRLNYVLGFEEPYNPEAPKRSGKIPEEHKVPGVLLAAFNGGFKGQHGQSGAMSNGLEVLPPREELGTVAMYEDGSVALGEWGSEIIETDDMTSWRQNGPLVVKDGQINPRIYNNDPKDWGYTVDDVSPTLRSGLGISQDGATLYYLAGPKLTMEALAESMLAAGVWDAIQLDINNYWVHFVVYPAELDELIPQVLLPDLMIENFDRYLYAFGRDYFYITPRG